MSSNFLWKLKRLRSMGASELLYRARQSVHAKLEERGIGRACPGEPQGLNGLAWCDGFASQFDVAAYTSAADRILAGRFNVFAMRDAALGFPPTWNQDPRTLVSAPLVFGKTLNYRDERVVGNIKYLWEPNRHLELVTLAQAWRLSGDARYIEGCQQLLDSWFEQCPYPLGVNWVSSLEHSVRLMNWSFAWHLLGGDKSPLFDGEAGEAFRGRWLRSVFEHCHFIAGHFSRYSSANNHLLGEYMGLLVGAVTWPMWTESATWKNAAVLGFEMETLRQNGPDGVNREQAVYYQHEVMDMMLLCGLICRANRVEFSESYWKRLEHLMEFLAAVMNRSGQVPMIGDADDALMVRLSQEPDWSPYRSLLATGAVLFGRGDVAAKAGHFDDKSRWLLGDSAADIFHALQQPEAERPRRSFPEAGYYLMGTRFGAADEVRGIVDCGPLGYLSIAAHGHADALSFLLSAGGRELLIDPGTYAYHTQKKWRNYFRGTFAHNTLCVDGADQSVIGGNFLWLRKANAHCVRAELDGERQLFRGWHDGYLRLNDPVKHQREIIFDATNNCFEVIDELDCSDRHEIELCWHLAEDCAVDFQGGMVIADSGIVRLTMSMDESGLSPKLLRGDEDPPAGWVSRSFDAKTPTTTIVWHGEIQRNVRLQTRLAISFAPHAHQIETIAN